MFDVTIVIMVNSSVCLLVRLQQKKKKNCHKEGTIVRIYTRCSSTDIQIQPPHSAYSPTYSFPCLCTHAHFNKLVFTTACIRKQETGCDLGYNEDLGLAITLDLINDFQPGGRRLLPSKPLYLSWLPGKSRHLQHFSIGFVLSGGAWGAIIRPGA